jgi:cell division protein FtsW
MTGRIGSVAGRVARVGRTAAAAQQVRERRSVLVLLPVAMLLIVGLGAMLSASSVVSIRDSADQFFLFRRQLMWVGLGLAALVVTVRVPYRWWGSWALPMYALAMFAMLATLVVGDKRNGAVRWIEVGPLTLQAAEFAKLATVALMASALTRKERWLSHLPHFAYPVSAILGCIGILLLLQPDFGTLIIIVGASFAIMVASAAPLRYVTGLALLGAGLMTGAAFGAPYRMRRLTGFLDPFADPLGNGHQAVQSLVALGTGGLFGIGLGASRARWSFLPNAHTDFIFAIIGEETGLAGAMLIVVLFTILAAVGVRIALKAPDRFGRLLAVGIVAWLTIQALVNIGGVVAVLPITGVPLPFVSSGGNAMLVNLAAVGVLVNIARSPLTGSGATGADIRR